MVPFENPAPQMLKTFLFKMTECVWLQTMRFGLSSFQLSDSLHETVQPAIIPGCPENNEAQEVYSSPTLALR